jgi:hypothetical protein
MKMGKLASYKDFEEKAKKFSKNTRYFRIDTVQDFDNWYLQFTSKDKLNKNSDNTNRIDTNHMFRGMSEAKYKLLTSAQRFWIINELNQWWKPRRYLEFVNVFVENARKKLLFKKVFEYYKLSGNQRDFPILSILQHYGAPTPLMDWTYNIDVALYFATEGSTPSYSSNEIDQYFSIYQIDKQQQRWNEFNNLIDWHKGSFPRISSFYSWEDNQNSIFYISDFEEKPDAKSFRDERPITTIYNQNIIPQEGLFIFNPFSTKPLEDCFDTDHSQDGNNLNLVPFICVNIKKDLAEYVRRKIKFKGIDNNFIYPDLRKDCSLLINEYLDQALAEHNKI